MAVLNAYLCHRCDEEVPDAWSDDVPWCCGERMKIHITRVNTTEWGSPRQSLHLRDEPFGSRSELETYAKSKGMALGESSEKVGGARNEDHMNLGTKYSYKGSPKS